MEKVYEKGNSISILKRSFISITIYVVMIIAGCAIVAGLVGGEIIPMEASVYSIGLILLISAFIFTKTLIKLEQLNAIAIWILGTVAATLLLTFGNLLSGARNLSAYLPTIFVSAGGVGSALIIKGKKKRKFSKKNFC